MTSSSKKKRKGLGLIKERVQLDRAHRKEKVEKDFFDTLEQMDLKEHFLKLPKKLQKEVLLMIATSYKFISEGDNFYTKEEEQLLKGSAIQGLDNICTLTYSDHCTLSFTAFMCYVFPLTAIIKKRCEEDEYDIIPEEFKKAILFMEDNFDNIMRDATRVLHTYAHGLSDVKDMYLLLKRPDFDYREKRLDILKRGRVVQISINYQIISAQTRQVVYKDKRRTCYRVGITNALDEFEWVNLPGSILKGDHEEYIPVYIQQHAIKRLEERIDMLKVSFIIHMAFESLADFKCKRKVKGEKLLVPISLYKEKLGYFVLTYVDGIFLITTFLFITQSGTPEGDLLDQHSGFKKKDKAFLNIDKLSTFIEYDIPASPELVQLLDEAKLSHLVSLNTRAHHIFTTDPLVINNPYFITDYIRKKHEEEQLSDTEMQEQMIKQLSED